MSKTLKWWLPQDRNKQANPIPGCLMLFLVAPQCWHHIQNCFCRTLLQFSKSGFDFSTFYELKNYLLLLCVPIMFICMQSCLCHTVCVEVTENFLWSWLSLPTFMWVPEKKGQYFLWHNFYFSTLPSWECSHLWI